MKNILILGARGRIAQHVVAALGTRPETSLTLMLRDPTTLSGREPKNAKVLIGDVLDKALLKSAVAGQDIVYANLSGEDLDKQAKAIIGAMKSGQAKRLVFVLSLGIYDEVPGAFGAWNNATIGEDLKPYRRAADAIEASGLDYTILRPGWLTDDDEVDYALTAKGEPFQGTVVSRKSVGDLIAKILVTPELHVGQNLGVHKPGSDGDKPSFL